MSEAAPSGYNPVAEGLEQLQDAQRQAERTGKSELAKLIEADILNVLEQNPDLQIHSDKQ
jgi:hypothetical protein